MVVCNGLVYIIEILKMTFYRIWKLMSQKIFFKHLNNLFPIVTFQCSTTLIYFGKYFVLRLKT